MLNFLKICSAVMMSCFMRTDGLCLCVWESLHPSMNLETLSVSNDDHESCSPNRSADFIAREHSCLVFRKCWDTTCCDRRLVPSGNSRCSISARPQPIPCRSLPFRQSFCNPTLYIAVILTASLSGQLNTYLHILLYTFQLIQCQKLNNMIG